MPQSLDLASIPGLRARIARAKRNARPVVQMDARLADGLLDVYDAASTVAGGDCDGTHGSLHAALDKVEAARQ